MVSEMPLPYANLRQLLSERQSWPVLRSSEDLSKLHFQVHSHVLTIVTVKDDGIAPDNTVLMTSI